LGVGVRRRARVRPQLVCLQLRLGEGGVGERKVRMRQAHAGDHQRHLHAAERARVDAEGPG
jgi:hypothetical protein